MAQLKFICPSSPYWLGPAAPWGAGVGLLLADKLSEEQRKSIGWTLVAVGVLTTIPLAAMLFGRRRKSDA